MCDETVVELLSNFEKFKKVNMEVKKMKDEMDSKVTDMMKRLDKIEKDKEKSTSNINQQIEQRIENIAANVNNQIDLEEEKEIEKRKNNVIFFGVPESNEKELGDRLEADYLKVSEVLDGKAIVAREDIRDIFRVGKKGESDTNRPLLLKFREEDKKMEVLRASKDLSIIVNNEIKSVYANIDRTPKQREEFNRLRAELKKRTDKGEQGLIIRGNKIVTHQFFHAQRAARTRTIWATNCNKFQRNQERFAPDEHHAVTE